MSDLYDRYLELEYTSYRSVVYFFEKHKSEINNLDFEEYLDVFMHYNKSLFEVGAYSKFIVSVDQAIELVIDLNVYSFKGKDIFSELLFLKAAAFFNLGQYKNAELVLNELIGINPDDVLAINLLKKTIAKQTFIHKKTRAISLFLFLFTAVIILLDILIIKNIKPQLHLPFIYLQCISFGLGLFLLVGGDLFDRFKIEQNVFVLLRKKKVNKRKKSEKDIFYN
ncbi:MAG: hypothetical protein IPQ04_01975 [Saprospiraceae bacterium]|nr:hypothetical protein [Saprospiraceae bacterium]